jgi:HEPN domain-containing protein
MTPLEVARAHLAKAEEFLAEAMAALERGHASAATSNAVIAGINAKDAMCLALVGSTSKADDHRQAVAELRRAGKAGTDLAPALDRLLKSKTRAQYQSIPVSVRDAEMAVRQAEKLVAGARAVVAV